MIIDQIRFSETQSERVDVDLLPFGGLLFVARVAIIPVDELIIVERMGMTVRLQGTSPDFISCAKNGGDDLLRYVFNIDMAQQIDSVRDFEIQAPDILARLAIIGGLGDPRVVGVASIADGTIQERPLGEVPDGQLLNS